MLLSAENGLVHSSNSKLSTLMTSSTSTDSSSICSATLMMSSPWVRRCLRTLALSLGLVGIGLWLLSFFNYINDIPHSMLTDMQDGVEVFTAVVQLAFFAIVKMPFNSK